MMLVGLALMTAVWSVTTPPGTAADEVDHYIKALAIGRGEVRGEAPREDSTDSLAAILKQRQQNADNTSRLRAVRWIAAGARTFELPTGLVPTTLGCFNNLFMRADTTVPAKCEIELGPGSGERRYVSYEAVNPPYMYVFSGAAMRLAGDHNSVRAYRLGRAAMGFVCLVLFGLAVILLWDRTAGPLSLLGAMVAITPTGIWAFSVLNPSGLEIAGATCFAAVLLRLLRPQPPPRWLWVAAAAGGFALATARSSGPLFVVLIPFCIGLLCGFDRLLHATRRLGGKAIPVAACLALGLLAAVFWLRYIPNYPLGFGVFDYLDDAISGLPLTVREIVGRFAGDYFIPIWIAVAWGAMLAALLIAAGRSAVAPLRRRLALVTGVVIVFTIAYATVYLTNGFLEFYGRYAIPGVVVLPLAGGWILTERREQLTVAARTRLVAVIAAGTGLIQLLAWWLESRRIAVGTDGPFFFMSDSAWDPPGGWLPWVFLMLVATAIYISAAWLPHRRAETQEYAGFVSEAGDAG
jgi:Predicted membrane protein (DUF2142)